MNYYNEFDPKAAAWLQQLIDDKQIPNGHVDSRSITEVQPSDLEGFSQCHFFAGIGGWSLALRLAGWPEDRPVWTASLPCQPFSTAGRQRGTEDERHLAPVYLELVRQCKPPVQFGEQVSSKLARYEWLPGIRLELEALGYSFGAADLCAPCAGEIGEGRIVRGDQESWERIIIGHPHVRQRLYWVADADSERRSRIDTLLRPEEGRAGGEGHFLETTGCGTDGGIPSAERFGQPTRGTDSGKSEVPELVDFLPSDSCGLGYSSSTRLEGREQPIGNDKWTHGQISTCSSEHPHGGLSDTKNVGCNQLGELGGMSDEKNSERSCYLSGEHPSYDLLPCRDGKTRRTESGIFPLVDGIPRGMVPSGDPDDPCYANATSEARAMRLKGYGNAIVPPLAALFITSYREATE